MLIKMDILDNRLTNPDLKKMGHSSVFVIKSDFGVGLIDYHYHSYSYLNKISHI